MSTDQLALTYAAFICGGQADAATLEKVIKAAGASVSASNTKIFAAILAKKNIDDVLKNVSLGGGGGGGSAAAPAAGGAAAPKAAAKEESEEEDDDMGMGLFD